MPATDFLPLSESACSQSAVIYLLLCPLFHHYSDRFDFRVRAAAEKSAETRSLPVWSSGRIVMRDYDHPFLPCFERWRDPAPLRAPGFVFDRRITATAMRRSGYCVTAAPDVSDTVTVGAAWLTKGSTATAATPARFMPSASAARGERSRMRPRVYGPRSLILTTTERPLSRFVTFA